MSALDALSIPLVAWRPLLDPAPLHGLWWTLIVPLSLGISMAYKAVSLPSMDHYWRDVLKMTAQIVVGLTALAAAFYVFVELVVPMYG